MLADEHESVTGAVAAVKALFTDVFHKGKTHLIDLILTEDFRFQYPFPGFSAGKEGIAEFTKLFHGAFPGFELDVNELYGSFHNGRPIVTIRWTFRGTQQGDFAGVKATSHYVTFSAIGMYGGSGGGGGTAAVVAIGTNASGSDDPHRRFVQLNTGWLEMDFYGLLHQLKLVPPIETLLPRIRRKF